MTFDSALIADTRSRLLKAANVLRGVEIDMAAEPPLLEDAVFHCQQAAEKAFKAFLTFHNQPFRRTHSLEEIGAVCLALDPTLQLTVDEAVPLSEYAWAYRYPGSPPPPDRAEAASAHAAALRVYQAVLSRIPDAAHPSN